MFGFLSFPPDHICEKLHGVRGRSFETSQRDIVMLSSGLIGDDQVACSGSVKYHVTALAEQVSINSSSRPHQLIKHL